MELVFLGTGGGRKNLVSQSRRTGGFRINGKINMHVDPGPGALFASHEFHQNARNIQLIIVTHNHIDHVNDAGLLIEAMSKYGEKNGWLIGSKRVIKGDSLHDKGISNYHLRKLEKTIIAKPGTKLELKIKGKKAVLFFTRVKHEDKMGFGFVLEMDKKRIGYTSDTEYFNGISAQYNNCDLLIVNNLKPKRDGLAGHLYNSTTTKLLQECRPKLAIITHMGMSLIRAGPEKQANLIQRKSGVKCIAAKDGMKIDVNKLKKL